MSSIIVIIVIIGVSFIFFVMYLLFLSALLFVCAYRKKSHRNGVIGQGKNRWKELTTGRNKKLTTLFEYFVMHKRRICLLKHKHRLNWDFRWPITQLSCENKKKTQTIFEIVLTAKYNFSQIETFFWEHTKQIKNIVFVFNRSDA